MKKTIYTLLGLLLAAGLTSCQDWFIEKPEVTGMDQDEVFSTAKNAEGAIAEAYATILSSGLPVLVWNNSPIMPYETTEAIMGGEDLCRLTWGYMDKQVVAGMLANNENNGAGYTDDYFPNNYAYIRKAWLVYENIDKVADMSDRDKAIVKAEMQVLVAFRYVEMLKRYGGVPLVESTLTTVDVRPRSTVQQTLDFIVGLCDAAAATLEGVRWPADWLGRVNKGVALAVKAEEGKLFGTVTATDLAEALAAKGITVDRKQITVDAIKTVGEYEATARLHKEVKATIKFSVTAAE